jgi:hypothetical protein
MRARRDLSFAGRRVHSIRLLDENGSMGRVVCELLSTQKVGPRANKNWHNFKVYKSNKRSKGFKSYM